MNTHGMTNQLIRMPIKQHEKNPLVDQFSEQPWQPPSGQVFRRLCLNGPVGSLHPWSHVPTQGQTHQKVLPRRHNMR